MFNINYVRETGEIISYQEALDTGSNLVPPGCASVSVDSIPNMFNNSGHCVMRVNTATGELVSK